MLFNTFSHLESGFTAFVDLCVSSENQIKICKKTPFCLKVLSLYLCFFEKTFSVFLTSDMKKETIKLCFFYSEKYHLADWECVRQECFELENGEMGSESDGQKFN